MTRPNSSAIQLLHAKEIARPGLAKAYWGFLLSAKNPTEIVLRSQSFHVNPFLSWCVFGFCVVLAGNIITFGTRYFFFSNDLAREEMPLFPVLAGILLALVIPTTKERAAGMYFWTSWVFWITYSLFGFAAVSNIDFANYRTIAQMLFKFWICIIGVPWLAFRAISPDRLPALHKAITAMVCFGGALAIYQFFESESMVFAMIQKGRGSGLWINPNHCGNFLTMTLFLSFIVPWNSASIAWAVRVFLLVAILSTLSRSAYLGIFVGSLTYAFLSGKFGRFTTTIALAIVFVCAVFAFAFMIDQGTIPMESETLRSRIVSILDLFRGNYQNEDLQESRFSLWTGAFEQIQEEGNLITGSGHGSMLRIKKTGHAPHNDFIQYLGDGGLVGLIAYLSFYLMLYIQAFKCKNPRIRGALAACASVLLVYAFTADKFLALHTMPAFTTLFAMWGYYGRTIPPDDQAAAFRSQLMQRAMASGAI